MKLLASTDYALRLLMQLAHHGGTKPLSVDLLAQALGGLSRHHLHKIVQDLSAMGLVKTLRGAGGGVVLAKAPETIRIGGVIAALESDQPLVECFRQDGGRCTLTPSCRLNGFLHQAKHNFYRELDARSLADCLERPGR